MERNYSRSTETQEHKKFWVDYSGAEKVAAGILFLAASNLVSMAFEARNDQSVAGIGVETVGLAIIAIAVLAGEKLARNRHNQTNNPKN